MSPVIAMAVLAALVGLSVLGSPAIAAEGRGGEEPRDFEALWHEAKRWAAETDAAPENCVFSLRFDPKTKRPRGGYSVTCEERYRSPFYPWPEASRAGVRFTADEVERYGRSIGLGSRRPGRPGPGSEDEPLEACGLVVGFTEDGRGAEAIECYRPQGNVVGQRANTEFVVTTPDERRVVSRLYERIAHVADRAVRRATSQPARPEAAGQPMLQIDGKVVGRAADHLMIRGRALPLPGVPPTERGVLMSEADIVVQYPSDEALRPGYYFGGEHCFVEKRETVNAHGLRRVEWVYGPCALEPDQYWVFEHYPPGQRTLSHGPYREYGQCDGDRKKLKAIRPGVVGGHCVTKSRAMFRMTRDGTIVVPKNAPPIE